MDFLRGKVPDGEEADRLVERALFLMATGYTYTEERREEGEKGEKIVRTRKQVPPNASAIALWLSHRMPERWGNGAAEVPRPKELYPAIARVQRNADRLREALEGGDDDGVSAVQSEAAPGDDLVAGAGGSGA